MKASENNRNENGSVKGRVADGRIYFSRSTERRFYFIMTLIMLILGILYKLEII